MIFSPAATEERLNTIMERLHRVITEHSGSIVKEEQWGVRRLAYPIRHMQEGNYVYTQFQAGAGVGQELDNTLGVTDEVLRHLVARVEVPSPKRPRLRRPVAVERRPQR